jgi:hypothetical protein
MEDNMTTLTLLREIVAASDADDHGSLMNAISATSEFIAEHDANQETYADTIQAARDEHHRDGEVELDDEVLLSVGDDPGIYVSAWVWIDFDLSNGG